jgi:TonB family protein
MLHPMLGSGTVEKRAGGAGPFFAIALVASMAGFGAGLVWPPHDDPGSPTERTHAVHKLVAYELRASSLVTPVQGADPVLPWHASAPADPQPRGAVGRLDPELRERWVREGERARALAQREAASAPSEVSGNDAARAVAPPAKTLAPEPAPAERSPGDRPPRRVVAADGAPLVMALDLDDAHATVRLRLEIGADGAVREVMVVSSEPVNTALERAAVTAARDWRYEPALRDGQPVEAGVLVTINFEPRP